MKNLRKIVGLLLLAASVGVLSYSLYTVVGQQLAARALEREYAALAALAQAEKDAENSSVYRSPVDFTALREINPDIVGWIQIEGTYIDYPILQCADNETYLHITFSGEPNPAGAIFLDYRSAADFSDPNTLIHGHNIKNAAMFALLPEYKAQAFYEEHPAVLLYTPEAGYRCEIFAAYVTAMNDLTYSIYFPKEGSFSRYLEYIRGRSLIQSGVAVQDTDRIIMLSTCDYQFEDARMVVYAKMVKIE
ncbi:MAG: class B sortase [Peptococcaceae bacterium]|nr:class B sortase [Peptococcaceae bacterium]